MARFDPAGNAGLSLNGERTQWSMRHAFNLTASVVCRSCFRAAEAAEQQGFGCERWMPEKAGRERAFQEQIAVKKR